MKQLNPLYIVALSVIFVLFVYFKVAHSKEVLDEQIAQYTKTETVAKKLTALKRSYSKQKVHRLATLLKRKKIASVAIELKRDRLVLHSKKIAPKQLNTIMQKVLNDNYNITKLKIGKLPKEKLAFEMEIQW